jgi:hypothetical protein
MSESYAELLAALREQTGFVSVDVQPPRDSPTKQCLAFLFLHDRASREAGRPQGSSVACVAITPEQARELLDAGAWWSAPAHLRAEIVPTT